MGGAERITPKVPRIGAPQRRTRLTSVPTTEYRLVARERTVDTTVDAALLGKKIG
jgi:hypothetical protein